VINEKEAPEIENMTNPQEVSPNAPAGSDPYQ